MIITATNAGGSVPATSPASAQIAAAPPVNTVLPGITGTAADGATLSSTVGTWTGTPAITYTRQWRRCDNVGANCADIAGATGTTYDLTPADVGARIRVAVRATNVVGNATATSAPTAPVAVATPANTAVPAITGTTTDGHTLTSGPGTWTGTPTISFARQWRRCDAAGLNCADITGATGTTYDLTPADVGSTIRVIVTGSNGAGTTPATSAPSAPIAPAGPAVTVDPTITGTPRHGATLTAHPGTWTGTPAVTFTYQWRRCNADGTACQDMPAATGSTYDLTAADIGASIRVVVTATNAGGTASATTAALGPVLATAPTSATPPQVGGPGAVGSPLTTTGGTWGGDPSSVTLQWQRCDANGANCADIPGATSATYTPTADDAGATIRATARATNSGGSAVAVSATVSIPAAVVTGPVTETPAPAPDTTQIPGGDDLGTLPGTTLSPNACQEVVTDVSLRRTNFKGGGAARLRVRSNGAVAKDSPIVVTLEARASRVRRTALLLDGHALRTSGGRGRRTASLVPQELAAAPAHVVTAIVTPKHGRARTLTVNLRSAPCATRFSAGQWRTAKGTALRLRVDSRQAVGIATFALPRAFRIRSARKPVVVGRLRVVSAPGTSSVIKLTAPAERRSGKLLTSTPSSVVVVYSRRGLTVTGLPAKTGIVEVTLYWTKHAGPKLIARSRRPLFRSSLASGSAKPKRLTAKLKRLTAR